jgi:hypothetical protein
MDTNKNPTFDWLRQELLLIKSRRFHIFDSLSADDFYYSTSDQRINLIGDYSDFLKEFGWARLFTDEQDAPLLSVYPLRICRKHICKDGKIYIGFGYRGQQSVYFDEQEILSTGCSKVYVVNTKVGREIASSFSEWLKGAYEWVRAKYSATQWKKIIEGPKPFSEKELAIVSARKQFKWRHIGFAANGDAIFEVENKSNMFLPYLSIGVQGKGGTKLVGGAWLDVSNIAPGCSAHIQRDCYKDKLLADELEVFPLDEPIPEKRERYWEFKIKDNARKAHSVAR